MGSSSEILGSEFEVQKFLGSEILDSEIYRRASLGSDIRVSQSQLVDIQPARMLRTWSVWKGIPRVLNMDVLYLGLYDCMTA